MGGRSHILCAFVTWLLAVPVYAHRPYEYVDASITDTSGRQLQLVKSFVDGIVLPDPCRVIIRDASGKDLDESPMRDDISIVCRTTSECLVIGYDASASVLFPIDVWRVTGSSLTPVEMSTRWRVAGMGLHVARNWFGYSAALVASLLPMLAFLWGRHVPWRWIRLAVLGGIVLGSPIWLCIVWFAVAFSYLSMLLVGLFAVIAGGSLAAWRPRWLGCGPTRP